MLSTDSVSPGLLMFILVCWCDKNFEENFRFLKIKWFDLLKNLDLVLILGIRN